MVDANLDHEYNLVAPSTTSYPLTLTDGLGRNVTFTEEPQRIVSIAPSATEVIYAVDAGDKVIAVDYSSNFPNETASLPKISNFPAVDLEALLVLNPDLVFGAGITSNDDMTAMENQGIQVFILAPFTLNEVLDDIIKVGQITNHETEATQLKDDLNLRLDSVLINASSFAYKPKIYLEFASDPLYTFGKGT
ncbi:MAG: ABC transporter substrate-binding protein, partial [Candidatus Hodarchaeales archaeon]